MNRKHRYRPRIATSISPYTEDVLFQVRDEHGFGGLGQVIDYIVHDWVGMKRAAIESARPQEEPQWTPQMN